LSSAWSARRAAGRRAVQLPGADRRPRIDDRVPHPDCAGRYAGARAELAGWLREGLLVSREDILEGGVGAFPDVLPKLFAGENIGKLMLAVP
jgi:NADPH-dependent curcumin reductase CurA